LKHNLSNIYSKLGMHSNAISTRKEAIDIFIKKAGENKVKRDSIALSGMYNALGLTYKRYGKLDSSKFFYEKAIGFGDFGNMASTNLGNLYSELGNYSLADSLLSKNLEKRVVKRDTAAIISSLFYLGNNLRLQGNYKKSDSLLVLSTKLIELSGNKGRLASSYFYRYLLDSTRNEHKAALVMYKKYREAEQKYFEPEPISAVKEELKVKYETKKKEKELAQEKLEKARAQNQLIIGGAIALLALFTLGIILYLREQARKREKIRREAIENELHKAEKDLEDLTSVQADLRQYQEELSTAAESFQAAEETLRAKEKPELTIDFLEQYRHLSVYPQLKSILGTAEELVNRVGDLVEKQHTIVHQLNLRQQQNEKNKEELNLSDAELKRQFVLEFYEAYPGLFEAFQEKYPNSSKRDKELFMLFCLGRTNKQIEQDLAISKDAFKNAQQRFRSRMGFKDVRELKAWVQQFKEENSVV
ncbi:MAG: hypothetical protein AAF740_06085, partial [Bacteroidota bacterium]